MLKAFILAAIVGALNPSPEYQEAAYKAQYAVMVQSGAMEHVEQADRLLETQAQRYAAMAGVEKELVVILYTYKVAKDKEVASPRLSLLGGSIGLTAWVDSARLGIMWTF